MPVMAANEASGIEKELCDSGASCHMSPFHKHFVTYHEISVHPITAVNNHIFYTVGTGDHQIEVPNGVTLTKMLLCAALHMLEMGLTVVSI